MRRMTGFILFWIAVGLFLSLFIEEIVWCITLIVLLLLIGYNMFCK